MYVRGSMTMLSTATHESSSKRLGPTMGRATSCEACARTGAAAEGILLLWGSLKLKRSHIYIYMCTHICSISFTYIYIYICNSIC